MVGRMLLSPRCCNVVQAHCSHGMQVVALPDASSTPVSPAAKAYGAVWAVAQTAATAVTLPLAIGLIVLLGWVVYLVVNNKTTIEYHEVRSVAAWTSVVAAATTLHLSNVSMSTHASPPNTDPTRSHVVKLALHPALTVQRLLVTFFVRESAECPVLQPCEINILLSRETASLCRA